MRKTTWSLEHSEKKGTEIKRERFSKYTEALRYSIERLRDPEFHDWAIIKAEWRDYVIMREVVKKCYIHINHKNPTPVQKRVEKINNIS